MDYYQEMLKGYEAVERSHARRNLFDALFPLVLCAVMIAIIVFKG